ncbi:MAG: PP2C family protein-serine/threonine phosphatase [Phycisphaerales bacterium]
MATATFTSEFTQEFDAETGKLLRRRFMWLLGVTLGIWVFGLVGLGLMWADVGSRAVVVDVQPPSAEAGDLSTEGRGATDGARESGQAEGDSLETAPPRSQAASQTIQIPLWAKFLTTGIAAVDISVYLWFFLRVRRSKPDKKALLKLTKILLLYIGVMGILSSFVRAPGVDESFFAVPTATISFGFSFLMASVFLPWSPQEVYKTVGAVLALQAVVFLAMHMPPSPTWLWLIVFPLFVAPGFVVCAVKHSSRMRAFKMRFLSSRYTEVRREMTDARRIHEDLFPEPRDVGDIVFTYTYQPMRQIGGDFLYMSESPGIEGRVAVNVVLLDVTGHGLAAALTVNRLHGELERIFAEDPHAEPGHVLGLLNRYVHLTLAQHSIYASAVCLRIDPTTNELTYANAGHPPMFLRGVDGTINELDSTAIVLGACRPEDFHADPQTQPFVPGDMVIAYTDGAMEARDDKGKCIGRSWLTAMMTVAACQPGEWPRRIIGELDARRSGPPEDDTLVIEVQRRLATDAPQRTSAQRQHA